MDDLQARALGSNITLQKLNIPELGLRFSKLANEILDLREIGIKDLNINTLKLMSTMKLTNQGTASLKEFIGKNSLNLLISTQKVQDLSLDLSKFAVSFGMTQETMFKIANDISQAIKPATLFGRGEEVTRGLSMVAAQIGDRATEDLKVAAELLTGVGKEVELMRAGIFSIGEKFISSSAEQQTKLLKQAVDTFNATWNRAATGLATGASGKRALEALYQQFGGAEQVLAMKRLSVAFQNAAQQTSENNQGLFTLKTAEERYANALERVAQSLQNLLLKLPSAIGGSAAGAAGTLSVAGGAIGAGMLAKSAVNMAGRFLFRRGATAAATGAAAGAIGGPVGAVIGAIVGIGSALWAGIDIWNSIKDSSQDTSESTAALLSKAVDDRANQESQNSRSLLDVLSTMVATLGPQTESFDTQSIELQKQTLQEIRLFNSNLASLASTKQPSDLGLVR
jgi:hypothetical protein